jgi:DNA-binding PadR family transcriptional regulator
VSAPKGDPRRELFVLGLLRRKPLSAYALDRVLRDHVPLYRSFSRGNVYSFVERLAESGVLLRRRAAAERGPSETRWIYRLSKAGEARFRELLRAVVVDPQSSDPALETALVLLGQLRRDEAVELIAERTAQVEAYERRMLRLFGDARRRGASAYFAASHAVHRVRSERRFLKDAQTLLLDAKWQPDWVLDDGSVTDPTRKL